MPAIPKPEPRKATKRRETARQRVERQATRLAVLQRDGYRCRACREAVSIDGAHVHELLYRSRGGSALDPTNCVSLCPRCHELVHAHRLAVVYGPSRADGEVTFTTV